MISVHIRAAQLLTTIALVVVFCGPAAAQERREYVPADSRSCRCGRTRHGGRAGEDRRAQSAPTSCEAGRQRGRRRGRDRLCAGGHLSARRQYRRRRLHGDPLGGAQRGHRHRLSRDRAGGDHARHVPRRRRQTRHRTSRAIPRSASACPAPSRAWRWRWRNTAPAGSRWRTCSSRRSTLARDGFVIADDMADTLPGIARRLATLAGLGEDIFPRRRHARCGRATGWCRPIWRRRSRRSPRRDRAASMKARSRKGWRRRFARPAAS